MTKIERPFQGKFIVLEGADGTGKTSLGYSLSECMMGHPLGRKKFISVLLTREPSNTIYGQEIRRLIASQNPGPNLADRLVELFIADRRVHIASQINPAVENGIVVLCDRYMYSTIAYQALQGFDMEDLLRRHDGLPAPSLTLFLDAPVEVRLGRIHRSDTHSDYFDTLTDFQRKLDESYRKVNQMLTDDHEKYGVPRHNIVTINADQKPEDVLDEAKLYVDAILFPEYQHIS